MTLCVREMPGLCVLDAVVCCLRYTMSCGSSWQLTGCGDVHLLILSIASLTSAGSYVVLLRTVALDT